jgi:hypothetical protein
MTIGLVAALAAAVFVPVACGAAEVASVRVVALSGDSPAGLSTAGGFTQFGDAPVIDANGQVAFLAAAGAEFEPSSVWTETACGLRRVAGAGEPAPGISAAFRHFADLAVGADGLIGFKATLARTTSGADESESIWIERDGVLRLIARGGAEAPDPTKDRRFLRFESPVAVNGDGHVAFFARTRDKELETVQDSGFYSFSGGALVSIATAAGPAVSTEPDVIFHAQSFEAPFADDPVINATGTTVFRGFIDGPGVDQSNRHGLWQFDRPRGLQLLHRGGDAAPGLADARFVSFPAIPTINNAGDTVFLAFYQLDADLIHQHDAPDPAEHPHEAAIRIGVWRRRSSGEVGLVLKLGDQAPGVPGDARFVDVFDPVMNGAGHVALLAAIAGDGVTPTNEVGLWSSGMSSDGSLNLVARQGDVAPGGNGTIFGAFLEPTMNSVGQTAFVATGYAAGERELTPKVGIWGEDRRGFLRLVVEAGQFIEVADGDWRQVAGLAFAAETGGEDGKPRGFNDSGQLAFHATFNDGTSGVFVSNALAVPEPRLFVLLLGAAFVRWRRPAGTRATRRSLI